MLNLTLVRVFNTMMEQFGSIHPSCQPCFVATRKAWNRDKTNTIKLVEAGEPRDKEGMKFLYLLETKDKREQIHRLLHDPYEPHEQYEHDKCFYCKLEGTILNEVNDKAVENDC